VKFSSIQSSKKILSLFPKELIIAVKQAIDLISQNPTLQEKLKGELSEIYKYKIYFQKTQYRIAYILEENRIVFLFAFHPQPPESGLLDSRVRHLNLEDREFKLSVPFGEWRKPRGLRLEFLRVFVFFICRTHIKYNFTLQCFTDYQALGIAISYENY